MKLQSYIFLVIGLVIINIGLVGHNSGWLKADEPFSLNVEYLQLVKAPDNNRIILENTNSSGYYWWLKGPANQSGFVSANQRSKRVYLPDGEYTLQVSHSPIDEASLWQSENQNEQIAISLKNGLLCRARIESI